MGDDKRLDPPGVMTLGLAANGSGSGTGSLTPSSIPPTPGERSDNEGINFMPKRAMTSFENLVAMANHQERLREARKMVWRDKGQPVVELDTIEACLAHAMSGGLSEWLITSISWLYCVHSSWMVERHRVCNSCL
jgi:hypothetical protein